MMMWSYCFVPVDADREHIQKLKLITSEAPLLPAKIEELLGGPYELVGPGIEGTVLAVLKDRDRLPQNKSYPLVKGPAVLGKYDAQRNFVGAVQVGFARS